MDVVVWICISAVLVSMRQQLTLGRAAMLALGLYIGFMALLELVAAFLTEVTSSPWFVPVGAGLIALIVAGSCWLVLRRLQQVEQDTPFKRF